MALRILFKKVSSEYGEIDPFPRLHREGSCGYLVEMGNINPLKFWIHGIKHHTGISLNTAHIITFCVYFTFFLGSPQFIIHILQKIPYNRPDTKE